MKQVLIKQNEVLVEDVPAPTVISGSVLVKVDHSCISVGTEMSNIKRSGIPLWERLLKQPENVKKVLKLVSSQGAAAAKNLVDSKIISSQPTGYSTAGIVLEVGAEVNDIRIGDRVACAGAQCAFHAEIICVPRNLVVSIPENLEFSIASTVTLGSIALQSIRRAQPTLGETFVVIGLGILGQLVAQMLKANGCRVLGIDLDEQRINLAKKCGMDWGILAKGAGDIEDVFRLSHGIGADGVMITASTPSDEVISSAFKMCRKKGRVVLVGDVGLDLKRSDFYEKEIDLLISTSYGPGRYDSNYEEKGQDYPIGYVRWTENRNMAEYLNLLSEGKINVSPLIAKICSIEKAPDAFEMLKNERIFPPIILLSYSNTAGSKLSVRRIPNPTFKKGLQGQIRVGVVGAGNFSRVMHLPNLRTLSDRFHIQAVMNRNGHNALAVAKQFNANYGTTNYAEILNDPDIDALIITTRHDLHAQMAMDGLKAGKHVLVEKPLALHKEELKQFEDFFSSNLPSEKPVLLTGFNRRFSRHIRRTLEVIRNRSNPMIIHYQMNAGYINKNHWTQTSEGGGRNLGEACHIYDLFTCLTESKFRDVKVTSMKPCTDYYGSRDNFTTLISFEDGSVASLIYTALGSGDYPKETMQIYLDGKVIDLDNYQKLKIYGSADKGINSRIIEKGHKEELIAFSNSIHAAGEWPVPLWQQIQAMEIAFEVEKNLKG